MDQNSKSNHQHQLGVNKLGKSIRKSPLHQSSFQKLPPAALNQQQPPPQPMVYNISKSDFRSVVQQLTGSPARDANGAGNPAVQARPPPPKHPSSRLMKIRPPPLTPIFRPPPPPYQNQLLPNPNPGSNLSTNQPFYPRPAPSPLAHGSAAWADSPVSAYMKYLESSLLYSDGSKQTRFQGHPLFPHPQTASGGPFPSPRANPRYGEPSAQTAMLPSPRSQFLLLSPGSHFPVPSPGALFPLPSPNSQFPMQSPSSFLNLLSPKSPYSLLSPRFHNSMPLTPNFSFSPMPQPGLLGPGPPSSLPPLPSPTLLFPPSPSGFLPLLSPRWREM